MTRQVFVFGDSGRLRSPGSLDVSGFGRPQNLAETHVSEEGFTEPSSTTLAGLTAGSELELHGEESHHAAVKRLRIGESVDLVDGIGWRATGEVVKLGKTLTIRLLDAAQHDPEPVLRLTLIQALAKEKRDMQALESACEIGVARVVPWGAARSVSRWDTVPKRAKGREKWRNLAVGAMKQSRQSRVAEISEYVESGIDVARLKPVGYADSSKAGCGDGIKADQSSGNGLGGLGKTVFAEVENIVKRGGIVFVLHESATDPLTSQLAEILRDASETKSSRTGSSPGTSLLEGVRSGLRNRSGSRFIPDSASGSVISFDADSTQAPAPYAIQAPADSAPDSVDLALSVCEPATALGESATASVTNPSQTSELQNLMTRAENPSEIAVVVGPEGGITEGEIANFMAVGARVALLGPTVLRCSTAGPAALAVIQAALGSWR